jgi:hypothetical protein
VYIAPKSFPVSQENSIITPKRLKITLEQFGILSSITMHPYIFRNPKNLLIGIGDRPRMFVVDGAHLFEL